MLDKLPPSIDYKVAIYFQRHVTWRIFKLRLFKERRLPLKITDVIGSGLPTLFLGRPLADSTTTRSMAAKGKNKEKKNTKSLKSVN